MSDIDSTKRKIQDAVGIPMGDAITRSIVDAGRASLNAMFPNDFEYYLVALEIVDSVGDTFMYLVFPIMPDEYTESTSRPVSIKKTMAGVTTVDSDTFVPCDITMSGTFGRRLKLLIGNFSVFNLSSSNFSIGSISNDGSMMLSNIINVGMNGLSSGLWNLIKPILSDNVKTGYGTLKILETMINMDGALDSYGKPFRLYFYNPAIGNNYLVKIMSFTKKQSIQRNTIWEYTVVMKGVAPLEYIIGDRKNAGKNLKNLGVGFVQRTSNRFLNELRRMI